MLGTSDAWSMSPLSQLATKPAYYIADCRIFGMRAVNNHVLLYLFMTPFEHCGMQARYTRCLFMDLDGKNTIHF